MKPLLLVLQAIGPYAGRQTIDFRPVLDNGLFGIYGATGSGKSTVFSAMMFALFGEAARSEQPATTLRSDHADTDLLTLVELVFSVGERTFRIVRQPEQMRPAKRGGGETREPHKAWLFDVTGFDIDVLSDANPGKVMAETKVKNVDDAVKSLLGYGPEQFRQIVLLPQGRFEAFLSADTNDRVDILRGLFDVSLYRTITERFKADADAAEKKVTAARAVSAHHLSRASFDSMEALTAGIEAAHQEAAGKAAIAADARTSWESAVETYSEACLSDGQFREHLEAERELTALESKRLAIVALTDRLKTARIIQSLADAASAVESARRDWVDLVAREEKAGERHRNAVTQANAAAHALQSLNVRLAEIEKSKSTLQTYRGYERHLDDSAALRDTRLRSESALEEADNAVRTARSRLESLVREHDMLRRSLHEAQASEVERAKRQMQSAELVQRYKDAKAYENARQDADHAKATAEAAALTAGEAINILSQTENEFASAEAALLENQAAHLAAHLSPGKGCPVCGSTEHPAPAGTADGTSDVSAAYQSAKASLETARRVAENARTEASVAAERATERLAALNSLPPPDRTAAELSAALRQAETELSRLPVVAVSELSDALFDKEKRRSEATQAHDAALLKQKDATVAAATARQAYDSALSAIPEDLRDRTGLSEAVQELAGLISTFQQSHESAVRAERQTSNELSAAASEYETLAAEARRGKERLAGEEERFAERLSAAGLTASAFESGKADLAAIPAFEAELQTHNEKRAAASDRLERARAAIAGLERPDLAALASARDIAKEKHDALEKVAGEASSRFRHLEKLRSELSAEAEYIDNLERETAPIRELAELFAGYNERKITLETFAISALFDRVLESANLRLNPMTSGRYALVREIEGKGLARRGLGIAVEDTFTGRQRPTSTLSGGETFIAALALALGLSDVVESAHGSVRLDTIFIDEGFGSLDSDNDSGTLETVLQTLQDIVGETRSVGVISHVPLVQQAIPVGFYVTKTISGSHIEQRF